MQSDTYFRRVSNNYSRFSHWTVAGDLISAEFAQLREFSRNIRTVLDVGAGTVRFLHRVSSEGIYPDALLLALDLSADMLLRHAGAPGGCARVPLDGAEVRVGVSDTPADRARTRADGIGRVIGDVRQLPMPDRSVDRIISRQLLHYVDPVRAIGEISRVLQAGGILHSTQQVDYDEVPDDWYTKWSALRDAPHRRRLSNRHLDQAAAQVGLTEVARTDVPIRLAYTWSELAYKYGRRDGVAEIADFFQNSPDDVKSRFAMRINGDGVRYSSRFRVSAFQRPRR